MAKAFRASILHFPQSLPDSIEVNSAEYCEFIHDGVLIVDNDGIIVEIMQYTSTEELYAKYPGIKLKVFKNRIIMPGFVDCHVHLPQVEMIGSYGEQLLEWLEKYTFPQEGKFTDPEYCDMMSDLFLRELFRNGTTTALVFCTVHKESVNSFFSAAQRYRARMISGKVHMDRHAPDFLLDSAETTYDDIMELSNRWHNVDRLSYAITPRFAPTSTDDQLRECGRAFQELKDQGVYMHTHLSESPAEIEWVSNLFPNTKGYLDVYDVNGLIGKRSVFAHGVHLRDDEIHRLAETDSSVAFCPTSNQFLGSGLLDLDALERSQVRVGIGTDVGGGTSLNVFGATLCAAYQVMQLQRQKLNPFRAFYLATLGGARTLSLDDKIGNLCPGKEADFTIINLTPTPLARLRLRHHQDPNYRPDSDVVSSFRDSPQLLEDALFSLMILGDDRNVERTYILGNCVHSRKRALENDN